MVYRAEVGFIFRPGVSRFRPANLWSVVPGGGTWLVVGVVAFGKRAAKWG